jgi:hypothetical protein
MRLLPPLVWVGLGLLGVILTEGFGDSERVFAHEDYSWVMEK